MILIPNSPPFLLRTKPPPNPFFLSPSFIYLNPCSSKSPATRFHAALKTESEGDNKLITPLDLHRKPTISNHPDSSSNESVEKREDDDDDDDDWVDWEDQILEDTVPLVGFVRMLLHSGKYGRGDRLSPEHEKTILERLLPYHPEAEKKIGCGIDFIKVDHHPEFEDSRCLFIVRKDGEYVDFSYWKCIKGLIKTNYPLYADSFILKHFRRRSGRSNV